MNHNQNKRQRSVSPSSSPSSSSKRLRIANEGKNEDCTICFEPFKSNGSHRVVTLHCGHLFGSECILRWLSKSRTCPVCKKPATAENILPIFATNVVVAAEPETNRIREQLEIMKQKNKELEQKLKDVKDLGINIFYCNICDMPFLSEMRKRKHERKYHDASYKKNI